MSSACIKKPIVETVETVFGHCINFFVINGLKQHKERALELLPNYGNTKLTLGQPNK